MDQVALKPGSLRWRLRRVTTIVQREGALSLWFRVLAKTVYHRAAFLVCSLDDLREPIEPRIETELTLLTSDEVDDYLSFRRGARREDYLQRLNDGYVCYAARCAGRIASVTWVARDEAYLGILDSLFTIEKGFIYLFDSFTHPDFRGQRLQGMIFSHVRSEALARGEHWACTLVVPENRPNFLSRGRMGFKRMGTAFRITVGPWRWYCSQGQAPVMRSAKH